MLGFIQPIYLRVGMVALLGTCMVLWVVDLVLLVLSNRYLGVAGILFLFYRNLDWSNWSYNFSCMNSLWYMVGDPCPLGCIWCQWSYQMVELAMFCKLLSQSCIYKKKLTPGTMKIFLTFAFAIWGLCRQQPGVQMTPPRPRRVERSNGPGGHGGRGGSGDDSNRGRRYRPY